MNLKHLAIFVAVAEEYNIRRVAARLGIGKPVIMNQLAELQHTVGTRLFERLPHGVRLTEAGERLYANSRSLFDNEVNNEVDNEAGVERELADVQRFPRGRLAVGASTTIGIYLLPEILTRFNQYYPGVKIALDLVGAATIRHNLLAGTLDLGLTDEHVDAEELKSEVFWEDDLVVIAPPRHPILREEAVSLARLCREPFVLRELGSGTRAVVEQILQQHGLTVQAAMSLGSTEAVKRAVAAGAGLAITSRLCILPELEARKLTCVQVFGLALRLPFYRLQVCGKNPSRALRAFTEHLNWEIERLSM